MRNTAIFILLRRMRAPLLVLIVVYAIAVIGLVLIPGETIDGRPHYMSFFHALYVISYTVTTIGYGEVPHPFTDAQRMWIVISIYLGVIGWLYAIGTLIGLLQDPAIRQILRASRFAGSVSRITEPFYIVCGYGDTGSLLVRVMTEQNHSAVVLDRNPERINELLLETLPVYVPGMEADASLPNELLRAGLEHPLCAGVVALTGDDNTNLKIAITAKLLRTRLRVICRAQTHDTQVNLESFGTDAVINHFDAFADRLAMAIHSPHMFLLNAWLTTAPGQPLVHRVHPPRGTWVLCGYGRFGKAVQKYLSYEGIETVIIEANPDLTEAPKDCVVGRGTEAVTLRQANIEKAVGIVAGTDNDANNLSIIITARELNSNLFLVARQNQRENDPIFAAAGIDLVMLHSRVIANRILSLIRTPLLTDFLRNARHQSNEWAEALIDRLWPIIGNVAPDLWAVNIGPDTAPAVFRAIESGRGITLHHLLSDQRNRKDKLRALPMLIKRAGKDLLLPEEKTKLMTGDEILFCGRDEDEREMVAVLHSESALAYVETGKTVSEAWIWRRFAMRS